VPDEQNSYLYYLKDYPIEMDSLYLASITFFTGLALYTLISIASIIYHKRKRLHSFLVEQNADFIRIKRNAVTTQFNLASRFFLYSLFTITAASLNSFTKAVTVIGSIYFLSFIAIVLEYYLKRSYHVMINTNAVTITIENEDYSLEEWTPVIRKKKYDLSENYDLYGLFIENKEAKLRLVYGYSVLWDIEALKNQIEERFKGAALH
jgi:hypothetical protein